MTAYNKLVRDKIPEYLDSKGIAYERRSANDKEYRAELIRKVVEEANEFAEAGALEELTDLLEVISALVSLSEYADVETIRKNKFEEKGGFASRIILKGEK